MNRGAKPMTVARVARTAAVLLEKAAMLDYLGSRIASEFDAQHARAPERLLQRRGEGPRPADPDAVADLTVELATRAEEHRERARTLLCGGAVDLPDLQGVEVDEDVSGWESEVVAGELLCREPSDQADPNVEM